MLRVGRGDGAVTDDLDRALSSVHPDRHAFLRGLVAANSCEPAVVSSFSMSGIEAVFEPAPARPASGARAGEEPLATDAASRRSRWWRRRRMTDDPGGQTVSRRRLFGLLGGAAAAGAGLAVVGAGVQPDAAGALNGNQLVIGETNLGTSVTVLQANSTPATMGLQNTIANANATNGRGTALAAEGTGVAIVAVSSVSPAVSASSNAAQMRLLNPNSASSGPPSSGLQGDVYSNGAGELWFCTVSGTPGTWVPLSSPFVSITPARVYDSRPGAFPTNSNPKAPIQSGQTVNVDVTNGSSIPSNAQSVVGNITAVDTHGPVGSYLVVFEEGSPVPPTSNLSWSTGQIVANQFTSQVNTGNGLISVFCSNSSTSTDFIVDLVGYYP
jgi:hypothetical protein